MKKEVFGKTKDGQEVLLITLSNDFLEASITNYGAILVSLLVPDAQGQMTDVVLGFDSLAPYLEKHPSFGTINGRYANRIAKGKFSIRQTEYTLAINNGPNHLHGGIKGIDKVLWTADTFVNEAGEESVKLEYLSPDGEEGYPGNLQIQVIYSLTAHGGIRIDYEAQTDAETVLNLTNHSYFNLSGGTASAMDHQVRLLADYYTPTDEHNIPTGEILSVEATPFDFREFRTLEERIDEKHPQLDYGSGYDHNFVLGGETGSLREMAIVQDPKSGRKMRMFTTEPGVQLYTANHLGGLVGKNGVEYGPRYALCLEAQHFPDSPNHPHFPSTRLRPGEVYKQTTEYRFEA